LARVLSTPQTELYPQSNKTRKAHTYPLSWSSHYVSDGLSRIALFQQKTGELYERLALSDILANTVVDISRGFQGLERISLQTRRAWLEDFRNGEEPAEFALLLILLPRLRFLRLRSRRGNLGIYDVFVNLQQAIQKGY
jgi:hypothetical protein